MTGYLDIIVVSILFFRIFGTNSETLLFKKRIVSLFDKYQKYYIMLDKKASLTLFIFRFCCCLVFILEMIAQQYTFYLNVKKNSQLKSF
jgi:hypothetical protein